MDAEILQNGKPKDIDGRTKAALLMLTIGEEASSSILRLLGEHEVRQLAFGSKSISGDVNKQIPNVLESYLIDMMGMGPVGENDIQALTERALGTERARRIINQVDDGDPLVALQSIEPRALASVLGREHPQTIAMVLAKLNNDNSSQVLEYLDKDLRVQVIERVAKTEQIETASLREVSQALHKQLDELSHRQTSVFDGVAAASAILRNADRQQSNDLLETLAQKDMELSEIIKQQMFTFSDVVELEDRSLREIMRELDNETLITALTNADERARERVFANVSKRAAQMIREDLEASGPVSPDDSKKAQREIVQIAMRLAAEKRITLD